jgi:uncharacterized protein YdaU (DUF1376 family)
MAKDPAILFYTSDFISGTLTMTDEQRGKYILLLCLQHQKGKLTEKDMLNICKTYNEDIFSKFKKNGQGLFFNERMDEEINKRKKYSESRRKNRSGKKKKPKEDMSNTSETYVKHMEDEDENININVFEDERFLQVWEFWKKYKREQFKFSYKPIGEVAAINKLFELSEGDLGVAMLIIKQSIENGWKGFFELKGKFKTQEYDREKVFDDLSKS